MDMAADNRSRLDGLALGWRAALDQAWASWLDGNFGIGAALVDASSGDVVSQGRNAVNGDPSGDQRLHANWMAHAEMNTFASLDRFDARGLHLYTTLQPCLMCAATTIFLNVEHVSFGAADEYFAGLDDLWPHHRYTAERACPSEQGLGGRLSAFCRLLPLTFTYSWRPDSKMIEVAARLTPELLALARTGVAAELRRDNVLTASDAIDQLWELLPA